jgi:preprotein translocase subunit SecF
MELIKPGVNINFIGRRFWFMSASGLVILASLISILVQGGLKLGVDFSGGIQMQVAFVKKVRLTYKVASGAKVTPALVRGKLDQIRVKTSRVELSGSTLTVVLNRAFNVERAETDLKNGFSWTQAQKRADDVAQARAVLDKIGGLTFDRAGPVPVTLGQIKAIVSDPDLELTHATVQTVYLPTETIEVEGQKVKFVENLKQITVRRRGQPVQVKIKVPAEYVAAYAIRAQEQDPELRRMQRTLYREMMGLNPFPSGAAAPEAEAVRPGDLIGAVNSQLRRAFPGQWFDIPESESVGPQVGEDLRKDALGAIFAALLLITAYIAGRFQNQWPVGIGLAAFGVLYAWIAVTNFSEITLLISIIAALGLTLLVSIILGLKYPLGATVALIHDVVITVGILSVTGKPFTLSIVAALLTIIGYSLNDTIVVYDRIRENVNKAGRAKLSEVVNRSINETLSRTVLTSGTTLMVLLSLYFLGGSTLQDFAFAMIIGVLVGTYSSIYIASPIVLLWPEKVTAKASAKASMEAAAKLTGKLPGRKAAEEKSREKPAQKKVKVASTPAAPPADEAEPQPEAEPEATAKAKPAKAKPAQAKPAQGKSAQGKAITKGKTASKGTQKKAGGKKKKKKKR